MGQYFKKILNEGFIQGEVPNRTQKSRDWFRQSALKVTDINSQRLFQTSEYEEFRTRPTPGKMYFYYYDPKTKEKLPVFDIFPLTLIYKLTPDGFYGLNFHYLPYRERAELMDALYEFATDKKYDEKTRIAINYQILTRAFSLNLYRMCLKRYLYTQMKSRFLFVPPESWDIALFLRVERMTDNNLGIKNKQALGFNRLLFKK